MLSLANGVMLFPFPWLAHNSWEEASKMWIYCVQASRDAKKISKKEKIQTGKAEGGNFRKAGSSKNDL